MHPETSEAGEFAKAIKYICITAVAIFLINTASNLANPAPPQLQTGQVTLSTANSTGTSTPLINTATASNNLAWIGGAVLAIVLGIVFIAVGAGEIGIVSLLFGILIIMAIIIF